jgi:hypothetical protein
LGDFLFLFLAIVWSKKRIICDRNFFLQNIFPKMAKIISNQKKRKKLVAQSSREDSIADLRKAKKNPSKCISSIASTEQSQDTMLCVPGPPLI